MDHIETAPDSPYTPLVIPCLSPEPYDHDVFVTYPERVGWDFNRLLDGDFTEHENAEAFLQDWLYFGVLWEVFGPIGKGGKRHYIRPEEGYEHGVITTASLDDHILELTSFISSAFNGGDTATAKTIGFRIEACLVTVSRFCRIATCEGDPRPGFSIWPLSPEIDLSIRALCQRLAWNFSTGIMPLVFSASSGGLEFPCAWLPLQRMQDARWCKSEVAMVEETFTSASAYYTSQLVAPPSATQKDHSKCTRSLCIARQLNEETYRTAHTTTDCDCQHYGPLIDDVISILQTGGVPLLSITSTKREPYFKVEVERYTEGKRYIAFSHVWSDGLGNPSDNTLPQCQLLRIQGLLVELVSGMRSRDLVNRMAFRELWSKKFHGPSLLFWMDTLCIPVSDEHRDLRSKAIKSMKTVYERAFRVLVLDGDIETFPSTDYTQSFMRIRLSAWMRRLWTLNEGVLANKLCIRFADGFLDVQERSRARQKETYGSKLAGIKDSYGTPLADATSFHWKFRLLRLNVISETDPRFFKRTATELRSPEERRCDGIMEAFSAALYRSTSKERDEMLCFASLIGWDISLLKGLPFEDHMHALLSTESQLPQGILFLAGPRMRQRGWRWAINRFGNCGAKRLNVKSDDTAAGRVTENGFVVKYPGLVLPANYSKVNIQNVTTTAMVGDDISATFQVKRHDEGLSNANTVQSDSDQEESDHNQLYVLFWDITRTLPTRTSMPAAIISGPSDESLIKGEVVYRFESLAYLEILNKHKVARREEKLEDGEFAQMVTKEWTIG
ncbi:hypothetical protein BDV18DRAFT_168157 [Aspergillus unguis]